MRIDAHQHYWSPAHGDYGWLVPTPPLRRIYRDFGPTDLHPLLDAARIDATVLVQAAPSEAETERLLEIAVAPDSRVAAVVGWCDLLADDAPERIARLAAHPLLKGLRPMLQDLDDPRWILQPALAPAWRAMCTHGLALDALVKGGPQVEALCEFVEAQPGLRIVVDHAAKPAIGHGWQADWARAVRRLARSRCVTCKLSGLVTEAAPNWTIDGLQPYVDLLLAEFGPGRLLWGSDWPVLNLASSYDRWIEACAILLRGLNDADHQRVFGLNAIRTYRIRPLESRMATKP